MSPVQRGLISMTISMIHLPITTNMELLQGLSLRLQPIRGTSILKIVLEILLILTPHIKSVLFRQGPQSLLSLSEIYFDFIYSSPSPLPPSSSKALWPFIETEKMTSLFSPHPVFPSLMHSSYRIQSILFPFMYPVLWYHCPHWPSLYPWPQPCICKYILFLHVYPQSANSWSIPDFTKCISSPG